MPDSTLNVIVHLFRRSGMNFLSLPLPGGNWRCRLGSSPSGQICAAGDQPCAAFICDIRPRPLNKDQQTVAKTNQKQDMHEQPQEPGDKSGDGDLSTLRDASGSADRGQTAFVPVVEGGSRLRSWHKRLACGA